MSRPYKSKNWKENLLFFVMAMGALAVMIALINAMVPRNKKIDSWVWVWPIVVFVVLIGLTVYILARRKQAQIRRLQKLLEPLGMKLIEALSTDEKRDIAPYIGGLLQMYDLQGGINHLEWFASSKEGIFFRHTRIVGSGKQAQVFTKIVAAFPIAIAPLANEPLMTAKRLRGLEKIGGGKRARADLKTGENSFDRDWEIWGHDETRTRFLTSQTRAKLENSPRGEAWHVGDGWVAGAYDAELDPENSMKFFHWVRDIARAAR